MSDEPSPLADFGGVARLFPLPDLVLFPHVVQPLHVFEPRYRRLMADALAGDRLIALALLRPGWEEDYHKRPPVHDVVCLGRIFQEEELPDGRYNLLLHGLSRARVLEELKTARPYRSARVELLHDVPVADPARRTDLRRSVAERLGVWFAAHPAALAQLSRLLESDLPLAALSDVLGFALPLPAEAKQELLAEADVERRVRRLLALLDACPAPAPPPAEEARPPRKFPPDFSVN
jgi:Lon protease-like protein